jgi:methylamine dehydrogenase heavy chain
MALLLSTALIPPALAQSDKEFVPEKVTVQERINPGPNVFVLDQSWSGASSLNVLSADDLSTKGNMSIGLVSQVTMSPDRKTAYFASIYPERIMRGPVHATLEEFDVDTLTVRREIPLLDKMAEVSPSDSLLTLSADGAFMFVANATPASSVSVVDLSAGTLVSEIPTPGCWSMYPTTKGAGFTTLCGDGTFQTITIGADGSAAKTTKSEKIFDPDTDPLFIQGVRAGNDLIFISFNGNIYRVTDGDKAPTLVDKYSIVDGIDGGWAPGGVEILAYNKAHDVLFVTMHPDASEGSHKDPATEVWAVTLADKTVQYRSVVSGVASIAVTGGDKPVLFGANDEDGVVTRYDVDPEAKFAAKLTETAEDVGSFIPLVIAEP